MNKCFRYNNRKDENGRKLTDAERFGLVFIAGFGEGEFAKIARNILRGIDRAH
jgi:hypothetical protein